MTLTLRLMLSLFLVQLFINTASSQSLAVNTTGAVADNSSILDVTSTAKGMLVPRMTKAQRNGIAAPATGLLVYQNGPDSTGFHYYNGTAWVWLAAATDKEGWLITGNSNITSQHFLGTTNDSALRFRIKNRPSGMIDSAGLNTAFGYRSMFNNVSSVRNTAYGYHSLQATNSGSYNTAVGTYSLALIDTAYENTAIGYGASYYNKQNQNTAVGYFAGFTNNYVNANIARTGTENTSVGYRALQGNADGKRNTAVGHYALQMYSGYVYGGPDRNTAVGDSSQALSAGLGNTSVGSATLSLISYGSYNTAIGDSAMGVAELTENHVAVGAKALKNAGDLSAANTAIGVEALEEDTSGYYNVAVGFKALTAKKNGNENTAVGTGAMEFGDSTDYSVAIGRGALFNYGTSSENTAVGTWTMSNKRRGYWNTAVGNVAMEQDTSGLANTAIGVSSFRMGRNGIDNAGLGINSGFHSFSNYNTYMGAYAGMGIANRSTGGSNTGVGSRALFEITAGAQNVAMGESALGADTSGSVNVAIGAGAMDQLKNGNRNVAVGFWAGRGNLSGHANVTVGMQAAYLNTRSNIVAIGDSTLFYNGQGASNIVHGTANTAVGSKSAYSNSTGFNNTSLGFESLYANATGAFNTAVGTNALRANISAGYNTAIGNSAMPLNQTGEYNTALGNATLFNNNGDYNTATGHIALNKNTSGDYNTATGAGSLFNNQTGNYNTVAGYEAMSAPTAASGNSVYGHRALASYGNTAGDTYNNIFGQYAAEALQTGHRNVVMGSWAMRYRTGGAYNTAIGNRAQGYNANAGGDYNSSLGAFSLGNVGSSSAGFGERNTGVGYNAGLGISIGNRNSFLGSDANAGASNLNNASAIGAHAYVTADNAMVLGSINGVNSATASANIGIGTSAPLTRFHVNEVTAANLNLRIQTLSATYEPGIELIKTGGSATDWKVRVNAAGYLTYSRSLDDMVTPVDHYLMWTSFFRPADDNTKTLGATGFRWTTIYASNGVINTSDARDKQNIENISYGLKEIMQLRPVSYQWKQNPQWGRKIGFIAQEVQPVLKEVVQVGDLPGKAPEVTDNGDQSTSDKLGIYYADIIPVAVKAIQEQQQIIEKQNAEIDQLKSKNKMLEEDIKKIKEKLGIQ